MSDTEIRVCHITTLHARYDVRIFQKECKSLAEHYRVFLVVADGLGNENIDGINIIDAGRRAGSIAGRMLSTVFKAYLVAIRTESAVYHFHDPEFIFCGFLLKLRGRKVIYDVHEDLPRQILKKGHIYSGLRKIVSAVSEKTENFFSGKFNGIVAATPLISRRFSHRNKRVAEICNFAKTEEFKESVDYSLRKKNLCYIGGLTEERGLREMLTALEKVREDVRLNLAGKFENKAFEEEMKEMPAWNRVNYHGIVDRKAIAGICNSSSVGLVTLHPAPGYVDSLPVKMFEYMASALPVVASDFPLWKQIIDEAECGICVDPQDPLAIASAIMFLLENPGEAEIMGQNGKKSVAGKYSWTSQKDKLQLLYTELI